MSVAIVQQPARLKANVTQPGSYVAVLQAAGTVVAEVKAVVGLPGKDAPIYRRKHIYNSGNSYCMIAPSGAQDEDEEWNITRITVAANGSTTVAVATNVNATDYLTHTYE